MGRELLFRVLWAVVLFLASGATVIVAENWYYGATAAQEDGSLHLVVSDPALTALAAQSQPAARNAGPADGATGVPRDTRLSWPAGRYPTTYDVYFGVSATDVNSATRTDTTGILASKGQTSTTFDPPASLAYGQTYYWRVDEVNQSPDATVHRGPRWSFTVEPYAYPVKPVSVTASSAQPNMGPEKTIDGSGLENNDLHGTDPTTMWLSAGTQPNWIQYQFDGVYKLYDLRIWNSNQAGEGVLGFGAREVKIEYCADGITWRTLDNVPEFARATGELGYAANTTVRIDGVMAKYVRLMINSTWADGSNVTGLSEVRFSHVPVQAFGPQPANATRNVSVEPGLNWRPGREAGVHRVFLGTDQAAVAAGTAAAKILAEHALMPTDLNFGMTYYWKVDEVNTVTYTGNVWSFTTQEYAVVDDFESYNDTDHRIYGTWIDGRTDGKSGSVVGYSTVANSKPEEEPLAHAGQQAMALEYNNIKPPYYSETSRTFDTPQNWAVHGATELSLYFRGYGAGFIDKGNDTFTIETTSNEYNIGGTSDEFRFVYKQLRGDGSLTMRVDRVGYRTGSVDVVAKAGPMIRETLDGGSRNACCLVPTRDGVSFQCRQTPKSPTAENRTVGPEAPYWVRIIRASNELRAERSADGKTWTAQGTEVTILMAPDVYVGMAVSNDHTWHGTTVQVSNVSTTGAVTGSWQKVAAGTRPWTDDPAAIWANDPAPLYLTVEDAAGCSKTIVTSSPEATTQGSWLAPWRISLSSLSAAGVNLGAVKKLTIGIGDKANPKPGGGTGLIHIDDIGSGRHIYLPATRS